MPTVKNVGEPCAREPHARFEVAAGGNQTSRASPRRAVGRLSPTLPLPVRVAADFPLGTPLAAYATRHRAIDRAENPRGRPVKRLSLLVECL
jgi:hypothetical protein